ncbi:translation factor GTPase family protein [Phytomonospora sp. NPDC050363]|uniref:translation factor GTPase family protein n=1 Tax=Phytomonospora sp. NPDC050363 TaxID=3155642 RepID=UPI0033CB1734
MRTLNLGILAHVDAGKTSLTERLLHAAGVIDEIGSVDDGSTRTDSMALERQRGITIKSAVVSFGLGDVTVNLIDTPGHPDFIAEVERVLSVLDGAVLVVSAVEGVQPQTRVLMRTLQRLRIPTLLFVNKIDRGGADPERVIADIAAKLSPALVPMGASSAPGTRAADHVAITEIDAEPLADNDDSFLAAYLDGDLPAARVRAELAAQTARAAVHPVYTGSAITGAGIEALTAGIRELLPGAQGDPDAEVSGTVFKIERGPTGDKIAYVRMFAGTVRTRDRLRFRGDDEAKVTAIRVFGDGADERAESVSAGRIGKLWGLGDVRIGDTVGKPPPGAVERRYFSPPSLETVVVPLRGADKGALHVALAQLAEQDPLINLRQDDVRGEVFVSLYGEVQKEVIQATLAEDFGVEVAFRETTTVHIERPLGTGSAVEVIAKEPNPFLATLGLRVEPGPLNSGVDFRLGVELGSMPPSFFRAVEDTVHETLLQGLHGWQVTDIVVTMTDSGYWARQSHSHGSFDPSMSSTAGDFRNLTPLVLAEALREAGTEVLEPMHRFRLEVPAVALSAVLPVLARLRAVPGSTLTRGEVCEVEGDIPAASVHDLEQRLPGLAHGEGVLESAFDHYETVRGTVLQKRSRTDNNPLNRREYLLALTRRVGGR